MVIDRPITLAVGIDREVFERLAPVLRYDAIDVDWIPTLEAGLVLVTNHPFNIVILNARPFGESLEDVVRIVRGAGSASSGASILVLAEPDGVEAAWPMIGRGVNQIMLVSDPPERIREQIAILLDVAPRATVHLPTRLETAFGNKGREILCQTENLSMSGMLVKTRRQLEIGSMVAFKIVLPDGAGTIRGRGELVRRSKPNREGVEGLGIRFLDFSADSDRKLEDHLAGYVSEEEPSPVDRLESPPERRRATRHDTRQRVTLKLE